jgi:transcriptional regulator with XRE-family HTH domain
LTTGERVKELRNALNLTQTEFGSRIGVSRNSVASYESGVRNMNDYILKNICRTFNADYFWLTEGKGDMFLDVPDNTIDELIEEYQINPNQKPLIKAYLKSSEETKERLLDFIYGIIKELDNAEQN